MAQHRFVEWCDSSLVRHMQGPVGLSSTFHAIYFTFNATSQASITPFLCAEIIRAGGCNGDGQPLALRPQPGLQYSSTSVKSLTSVLNPAAHAQVSALRQKLAAAAHSAAGAAAAEPVQALAPRDPPRDAAGRPIDTDSKAAAAEPGPRAPKQEAGGTERPASNGVLLNNEGF